MKYSIKETGEEIVDQLRRERPSKQKSMFKSGPFETAVYNAFFWAAVLLFLTVLSLMLVDAYQEAERKAAICRSQGMDVVHIYKTGTFCIDDQRRLVVP